MNFNELIRDKKPHVDSFNASFGGNKINMSTIKILENYGNSFDQNDTIRKIKIGTIGSDFMDNRITMIDFKNKIIRLYSKRPDWMAALTNFKSFDFKGRRFMLPATIDGKEMELFYDSGCSSFGLITTKSRYDKYTDKNIKAIEYNANRFGDPIPIHHKQSNKTIEIGNKNLDLKRISYVDMYTKYQDIITPFTKISGWLGNKLFTESILILDTQKQEFIVLEDLPIH